MNLMISKSEDDIIVKIKNDEQVIDFDYITFINKLYEGEKIMGVEYSVEIEDWEKSKIDDLVERFKSIAVVE